jgi:hypothetical protein
METTIKDIVRTASDTDKATSNKIKQAKSLKANTETIKNVDMDN